MHSGTSTTQSAMPHPCTKKPLALTVGDNSCLHKTPVQYSIEFHYIMCTCVFIVFEDIVVCTAKLELTTDYNIILMVEECAANIGTYFLSEILHIIQVSLSYPHILSSNE